MKIEGGGRRARSGKRDLFVELSEGIAALAEAREGKRTLSEAHLRVDRDAGKQLFSGHGDTVTVSLDPCLVLG